ncbi:MAG TPA: hypothetical protein VM848_04645 [Acidimicrobiia bacterium]|nr:hypothetical protein [Acidimicrobiia bacterium]
MAPRIAPSFVADEIRLHDGYNIRRVVLVEIPREKRNDKGWSVNFAAGQINWGDNTSGIGV